MKYFIYGFMVMAGIMLVSGQAYSDSLDVHITSWHSNSNYDYNTNNFGLGFTKTLNHHWSWKAGAYNNSFDNVSLYGGLGLRHRMKSWSFGADMLLVTDYADISGQKAQQKCINGKGKHPTPRKDDHDDSRYGKKKPKTVKPQCSESRVNDGIKDLNEIQPVIVGVIQYHFNRSHAVNVTFLPNPLNGSSGKDIVEFIGLGYSYTFGHK